MSQVDSCFDGMVFHALTVKLFVAFDLTTSTNNDSYFSFSKEVLMHSLLVSND